MEEKRKRGRPVIGPIKTERVNTRLSSDEIEKLNSLVKDTGMSKSEVIRTAILLFWGTRNSTK